MSLCVVPVSLRDACGFVQMRHRHRDLPAECKSRIGVADDQDMLRGVVVIGRPVAGLLDDGPPPEVTWTATDGTPDNLFTCPRRGTPARVTDGGGRAEVWRTRSADMRGHLSCGQCPSGTRNWALWGGRARCPEA